jgi:hypothetical protein
VNFYKEKIDRDPELKSMVFAKVNVEPNEGLAQDNYRHLMARQIEARK